MLKVKLKVWSKNNKCSGNKGKKTLSNQISNWETIQEQRPLADDELLQNTHMVWNLKMWQERKN